MISFLKKSLLVLVPLAFMAVSCGEKEQPDIPDFPGDKTEKEDPSGGGQTTPPTPATPATGPYDLSVLDLPLKDVHVLTSGTWLQNASVMQSFVLPGDGTMIACQLAATGTKHKLNVTRKGITSNSGKSLMKLSFFSHGHNMSHETDKDGNVWLWIGCQSTNTYSQYNDVNNVYFNHNQTVARVKFEAGKDLFPEDVEDQWYLKGMKNIDAAVDVEAGQIAFHCVNSAGTASYYYVYDLDAVKALPKKEVTLAHPIIRGPSEGYSLDPVYYKVMVHDLGDLTPLAKIEVTKATFQNQPYNLGTLTVQGYELHDGLIYHYYGGGNDSDPSKASQSIVSIFDMTGKLVEQHRVMAVASIADLSAAGITDTGFMESEGIKVYGDKLYLGYATKKSNDTHRYVTILEYPLKRKSQ